MTPDIFIEFCGALHQDTFVIYSNFDLLVRDFLHGRSVEDLQVLSSFSENILNSNLGVGELEEYFVSCGSQLLMGGRYFDLLELLKGMSANMIMQSN
ncbi:MAG: hypothetical protein AAFR65_12750 [Pseudomonadota bacterium]